MKRFALTIILAIFIFSCSKVYGGEMESGTYNFVSITIDQGDGTWPMSFDMLFPVGDTIRISNTSLDEFVRTILGQGAYVPNMSFSCPRIFGHLFNNDSADYDDGLLFVSDFNIEFERHKDVSTINLQSGLSVKLACVQMKGFFYNDKEFDYCTSDSNGVDISKYHVSKCMVPVAFVSIGKINNTTKHLVK